MISPENKPFHWPDLKIAGTTIAIMFGLARLTSNLYGEGQTGPQLALQALDSITTPAKLDQLVDYAKNTASPSATESVTVETHPFDPTKMQNGSQH